MSKIAVVTGVASGIGEEAAHDLVAHDWAVYGLDVTQDGLDKTAAALKNERFHPVLCDIRSAEAVQSAMAEIGNRTGKINALIASAGVNRLGALSEMSVEDFNLVFDVNVRGLWLSARETIPFLRAAAKDGAVLTCGRGPAPLVVQRAGGGAPAALLPWGALAAAAGGDGDGAPDANVLILA